jgi:hypothetical protein
MPILPMPMIGGCCSCCMPMVGQINSLIILFHFSVSQFVFALLVEADYLVVAFSAEDVPLGDGVKKWWPNSGRRGKNYWNDGIHSVFYLNYINIKFHWSIQSLPNK